MYRIYQILILPLLLVHSVVFIMSMWLCCLLGFDRVGTGLLPRWWAKSLLWLLLRRVEVHGREHLREGEHYVFMANHQGMLDIPMINGWLGRDFKWMMKKELERVPLFGGACRAARFVMVDNSNAGTVRRTCREAAALMREGYSICLFPEGSRSWDGRMTDFHKGGFVLAKACGFPIVPITVNGSYEALPRAKGISLTEPSRLSLTIHDPIDASASCEELMQRVRDDIHKSLDDKFK